MACSHNPKIKIDFSHFLPLRSCWKTQRGVEFLTCVEFLSDARIVLVVALHAAQLVLLLDLLLLPPAQLPSEVVVVAAGRLSGRVQRLEHHGGVCYGQSTAGQNTRRIRV